MSATGGNTTTLQLVVTADKTGLDELQRAFAGLTASTAADLSKATQSGVAALKQARSDQAKAAKGAADAENSLTQMMLNSSGAAGALAQKNLALTETRAASRTAALAETEATQMLTSATRGLASGVDALQLSYGRLIPMVLGFAAGTAIKDAIKTGGEFQYQLQFVGAIAGETGEKLTAAGEQFKQFSLDSQFSAEQVARGARTLVQAGLSLQDSVKVLPELLKFSTLGEIELAQGAEIATGTMHAFGLSIADMPHILDSTAKAAQISQTNISEMGQALRQASTVGQQFGVSIDEMNALLAVLAERNIRGSAAGTALMNMFRTLDPSTQKGRQAFKELGVSISDTDGKFRDSITLIQEFAAAFQQYDQISQNRLADSMFTNRGAKAFLAAIAEAKGSLGDFYTQIHNGDGTLNQQAAVINETFKVQGVEAMNAWKNASIDAFTASAPALTDMATSLKTMATDPAVKQGLVGLVETFVALAGLMLSFANSTGKVVNAVTNNSAMAALQNGMRNAAQLYDPQVLIDPTQLDSPEALDAARQARIDRSMAASRSKWNRDDTQSSVRSLRASEIDYTNANGTADWQTSAAKKTYDPEAIKAAQQAAQAEIGVQTEKFSELQRNEHAYYTDELNRLKAYHSAGLISDDSFNQQVTTLDLAQQQITLQQTNDYIAQLFTLRAKVGEDAKTRANVDKAINKAQEDQARQTIQAQAAAVSLATAQWGKYNQVGQEVVTSTDTANAQMKAQIEDLTNLTQTKKDHTLVTIEARLRVEEETLARLENEKVLLDSTEILTAKQAADLAEINVITNRIGKLKEEKDARLGLIKDLKDAQNDLLIGAVKGLDQYMDQAGSTSELMAHTFKNGFTSMENALVDFVTTGKANFTAFADSVINDIARIVIHEEITLPLATTLRALLTGNTGSAGGAGSTAASLGSNAIGSTITSAIGSALTNYLSPLFGTPGNPATILASGGTEGLATSGSLGAGGFQATMMKMIGSLGPAGWGAIAIAVGAMINNQLFSAGYRAEGLPNNGTSNALSVLGLSPVGAVSTADKLLRGLGLSDRMASLLSGSSLVDRIFGHGATHADAQGVSGSFAGTNFTGQNWQDYSQKGGVFSSDRRWTENSPFTPQQQSLFDSLDQGVNSTIGSFGHTLNIDPNAALSGYSHDFNIQTTNNGAPLTDAEMQDQLGSLFAGVLQDQVEILLQGSGHTELSDYVKNLTGSADQIASQIEDLGDVMAAIPDMHLKGLSAEVLLQWKQGSETLEQTFQRVGGEITDFDNNFESPAHKLATAQKDLTDGFSALGVAIPASKDDFYSLVHGIDLSTQSGRDLFDGLMKLAPAFLTVGDAADQAAADSKTAAANFRSVASGLSPQYAVSSARMGLVSSVNDWMSLNPANGSAGGWTVDSTISNIGSIISSQGFEAALAYAQSLGDPKAVDDLTAMFSAYGNWQQALTAGQEPLQQFTQAVSDANDGLKDWAQNLLLSDKSPLTPQQQLGTALDQYQAALGSGDSSKFQTAADALLTTGRSYYGSGDGYTSLFNRVITDTQKLGGFSLGYASNTQAASIDQMRSDLVSQLIINNQGQQDLQNKIVALMNTVAASTEDQKRTLRDAIDSNSRAVVAAVESLARN